MTDFKKQRLAGWILSCLLAAFLIGGSAMGKFTEWEGKAEMLEKLGFTAEVIFKIGVLEVIVAILYVIPRTSFLGAILVTGYLGGATVTHLRIGESVVMPVAIGVIAWIGLGLRYPEVFRLAWGLRQ